MNSFVFNYITKKQFSCFLICVTSHVTHMANTGDDRVGIKNQRYTYVAAG